MSINGSFEKAPKAVIVFFFTTKGVGLGSNATKTAMLRQGYGAHDSVSFRLSPAVGL